MKGFLGSILGEKADHIITATKSDNGDYRIKFDKCRFGPINAIDYSRDEWGMPVWDNTDYFAKAPGPSSNADQSTDTWLSGIPQSEVPF